MEPFACDKVHWNSKPKDYTANTFAFSDAYFSIFEFMGEHFAGAVEVTSEIEYSGFISISGSGLAYLIKKLLSAVLGKSVLKIHIKSSRFSFAYDISWQESEPLAEELKAELRDIATLSGFEAVFEEQSVGGKATLNFKTLNYPDLPIYAKTPRNMRTEFEKLFFFIKF